MDDPELVDARAMAMRSTPIAEILAAQDAGGWWAAPGPGYMPKYSGTVWQVVFLDQLGAAAEDERVIRACEYVLEHTQTSVGGFGHWTGGVRLTPPPPSSVVHCLNGNLLRALIGFGFIDDPRVGRAVDWAARSALGEGGFAWSALTPGPGFRCGANDREPCAWGAIKTVLALARIPPARRSSAVERALACGVDLLLSRNPAVADYPMGGRSSKPSSSWFRLGFPSGYVADVLQVLEALCEAGSGADPRIAPAVEWLLQQQDAEGRWANTYAYEGKMVVDIDVPGRPSRWVTLRACRVLAALS